VLLGRRPSRSIAIAVAILAGAARCYGDVRSPFDEEDRAANNSIYAEGLGPGIVYSLDYDRAFGDAVVRVGAGVVPGKEAGKASTEPLLISVPLTVSYIGAGSRWNMLELGAGLVYLHVAPHVRNFYVESKPETVNTVLATGIVGYRFQPPQGGLLIRAGVCPIIGRYGFFPLWPYLALGVTF
jgi:hypothetical protein